MVSIVIHTIWFLIPAFFFLLALFSKLEELSGRSRKANIPDLVRQGSFVLGCSLVAYIIDRFLLQGMLKDYRPEWLPLGFLQLILLPLVLYVAAAIFGPSRQILIKKAPRPTAKKGSGVKK